jgi:anaerobic nitric oxide reductase transcription regulator
MEADWPGNVRELDHVLGRAVLRAGSKVKRGAPILMGPEHFDLSSPSEPPQRTDGPLPEPLSIPLGTMTLAEAVDETKRLLILRAVEESGGNWAAAARALGMARGNLHHMATRLGLRGDPSASSH